MSERDQGLSGDAPTEPEALFALRAWTRLRRAMAWMFLACATGVLGAGLALHRGLGAARVRGWIMLSLGLALVMLVIVGGAGLLILRRARGR